ncbi:MAG: iron-only hydrogenase system regulator [Victivallaceae bacterium]|nr:iron-only hydrogenase system regulator [Victivallaceae bacterium]
MKENRRIALIGIIVEANEAAEKVNAVLHAYADHIIGRMGIPYRREKLAIISVVLDAPSDVVGALAGKLGMIEGVSVKSLQSKVLK